MKKRIIVAMSGGVDSSVAAQLSVSQGHEVVGVTMCLGIAGTGEGKNRCCGVQAIEDARRVCRALKIPHYVLDFSREMEQTVVQPFLSDYQRGRTPNPCINCNQFLKFGKLLAYAREFGFDAIATGHYARIGRTADGFSLQRPRDRRKDQTYFLYAIPLDFLPHIIFPLADYTKEQVRELAHQAGLPVAEKAESQDICFVPDADYAQFMAERGIRMPPGDIVDQQGRVLGRHNGVHRYTRGQRSGLGIAAAHPLYVVDIDVANNRLVVGDREAIGRRGLVAGQVNRLAESTGGLSAQIRSAHKPAACTVEYLPGNRCRVVFAEPQDAITPGQAAVWYQADTVVGGGVIDEVEA